MRRWWILTQLSRYLRLRLRLRPDPRACIPHSTRPSRTDTHPTFFARNPLDFAWGSKAPTLRCHSGVSLACPSCTPRSHEKAEHITAVPSDGSSTWIPGRSAHSPCSTPQYPCPQCTPSDYQFLCEAQTPWSVDRPTRLPTTGLLGGSSLMITNFSKHSKRADRPPTTAIRYTTRQLLSAFQRPSQLRLIAPNAL